MKILKNVAVTTLMLCSGMASAQLPNLSLDSLPVSLDALPIGLDALPVDASLLSGGLSGVPLIGSDLATLQSPEGITSAIEGLVSDQALPVAIPIVGYTPLKLYGPVGIAAVQTQLNNGPLSPLMAGQLPSVPKLPTPPVFSQFLPDLNSLVPSI